MTQIINTDKIRRGDRLEFRKMVDSRIGLLHVTAVRICCNDDDAKDMVQDTFVKVWEKRKSLRDYASLDAFLYRVTVNKCYDLLRKKKRNNQGALDTDTLKLLAGDQDADKELNDDEINVALMALTEKLSAKQKIVFSLIELENLSHDEVASITGISKNSIKSNLRHARKKMESYAEEFIK